jgi:hypothetical protein
MLGVLAVIATAAMSDAAIMCIKAKKGTAKEGAPIKLRTACLASEVEVDPVALGLQGPQGAQGAQGSQGIQGVHRASPESRDSARSRW